MQLSRNGKAGLLLWIGAEIGAIAVSIQVVPLLLQGQPLPMPLWALCAIAAVQSGLYFALAVWAGCKLGPKVGLGAPLLAGTEPMRVRFFAPALLVSILGGLLLFFAPRIAPAELVAATERFQVPLLSRILYGGISEEVLMRFGLMTFFAWLAWRLSKKPTAAIWAGNVIAAVLFGFGHLPATKLLVGTLSAPILVYVVGVNAVFGIAFGLLYHKRGLENAIVGHAGAHLVAVTLALL